MTIKIGETVSFQTHAPSVLGNNFKNIKVEAVILGSQARLFGVDVVQKHSNVRAFLPEGYPTNPLAYEFLVGTNDQGVQIVVGLPWIKESTIESLIKSDVRLRIKNAGAGHIPLIRSALAANGFSIDEVETIPQ